MCYKKVVYVFSFLAPLVGFIWMRVSQPILDSQELIVKNWLYINFILTILGEPVNEMLEWLRFSENLEMTWYVICLKQEKYEQLRNIYLKHQKH